MRCLRGSRAGEGLYKSWAEALLFVGALLSGPFAASIALAGPAINQFEVKDLEASPGDFQFQNQNAFSTGQPRRHVIETAPGSFAYDDNSIARQRESLEVELGITDWFRVRLGVEYEQERLDDPSSFADANAFGSLQFDEVGIEGVLVFVKPKPDGIGLGWLFEYDASVGGGQDELYLGPIIEAHSGRWSMIANFAMVRFLFGQAEPGDDGYTRDDKWDFAYSLQGSYRFSDELSLALEAYGTIDRIGNTGARSEVSELFGDFNQHRIGPVLYYKMYPFGRPARSGAEDNDDGPRAWSVTVGTGVLFGLNDNTPDQTYKLSIEVDY